MTVAYRVLFTTHAAKQFDKLPKPTQEALRPKISALGDDPRPAGAIRLSGADNAYRIRAGDYRVIYTVQDDVLTVLVIAAGNRREVYR